MSSNTKYRLQPSSTLAILIGISKYFDYEDISPAPNNVKELAEILKNKTIFGLPEKNIKTIIEGDSDDIQELLIEYTEDAVDKGIKTLLLYYVGHGIRSRKGNYYLGTGNTRKRLVSGDRGSAISYDAIKDIVKDSRVPKSIIILDACYSGLAVQGEGFDDLETKGAYTITSSDSKEVSFFDKDEPLTYFTKELIEVLQKGVDIEEKEISLDRLYQEVSTAVKKRNPKMSPQLLVSKELSGSNFLFFKNRNYDGEAKKVRGIEKKLKRVIGFIENGEFEDGTLFAEGLKKKAETDLMEGVRKTRLLREIEALLDLCLRIPIYLPHIEPLIERKFAAQIEELQKRLADAEEAKRPLETKLESLEKELISWEKENGQLQAHLEEQEKNLKKQKAELTSKNSENDDLKGRVQDYLEEVSKLKKELESLRRSGISPTKEVENNFTQRIGHLSFNMIRVKGGEFEMGSGKDDPESLDSEYPRHEVTLPDFFMAEFPVTLQIWKEVIGKDPAEKYFEDCENCPVTGVSWNDAQQFLEALNQKTGKNFRLPSESEWEYAARGGAKSRNHKYAGGDDLEEFAWFKGNSKDKTHPIGEKKANELGIFDMSGNVWEWCEDTWHSNYEGAPKDGSPWVDKGVIRVCRGGSWTGPARGCRVADRYGWPPAGRSNGVGFRLAHSL